MRQTQQEIYAERKRLIDAYNNHHLTWRELMEAIDCLQFDMFQIIEAA